MSPAPRDIRPEIEGRAWNWFFYILQAAALLAIFLLAVESHRLFTFVVEATNCIQTDLSKPDRIVQLIYTNLFFNGTGFGSGANELLQHEIHHSLARQSVAIEHAGVSVTSQIDAAIRQFDPNNDPDGAASNVLRLMSESITMLDGDSQCTALAALGLNCSDNEVVAAALSPCTPEQNIAIRRNNVQCSASTDTCFASRDDCWNAGCYCEAYFNEYHFTCTTMGYSASATKPYCSCVTQTFNCTTLSDFHTMLEQRARSYILANEQAGGDITGAMAISSGIGDAQLQGLYSSLDSTADSTMQAISGLVNRSLYELEQEISFVTGHPQSAADALLNLTQKPFTHALNAMESLVAERLNHAISSYEQDSGIQRTLSKFHASMNDLLGIFEALYVSLLTAGALHILLVSISVAYLADDTLSLVANYTDPCDRKRASCCRVFFCATSAKGTTILRGLYYILRFSLFAFVIAVFMVSVLIYILKNNVLGQLANVDTNYINCGGAHNEYSIEAEMRLLVCCFSMFILLVFEELIQIVKLHMWYIDAWNHCQIQQPPEPAEKAGDPGPSVNAKTVDRHAIYHLKDLEGRWQALTVQILVPLFVTLVFYFVFLRWLEVGFDADLRAATAQIAGGALLATSCVQLLPSLVSHITHKYLPSTDDAKKTSYSSDGNWPEFLFVIFGGIALVVVEGVLTSLVHNKPLVWFTSVRAPDEPPRYSEFYQLWPFIFAFFTDGIVLGYNVEQSSIFKKYSKPHGVVNQFFLPLVLTLDNILDLPETVCHIRDVYENENSRKRDLCNLGAPHCTTAENHVPCPTTTSEDFVIVLFFAFLVFGYASVLFSRVYLASGPITHKWNIFWNSFGTTSVLVNGLELIPHSANVWVSMGFFTVWLLQRIRSGSATAETSDRQPIENRFRHDARNSLMPRLTRPLKIAVE